MRRTTVALILCASLGLAGHAARGAEPEPTVSADDLPRIPPTSPEAALNTFKVKPGFELQIAAAEPLVVDPIAMSFDEHGRLFVVEMRDYSERRPERLGRVRLLTDTDRDGYFESSTVYVDDLPWPTAVIAWDGGVFVGSTPDLLFCRDENGDGVADVREVVFTGFASDYAPYATNRLNVQALLNSFSWTLENRIHGSASLSGGRVSLVDSPFTREWRRRAGVPIESDSKPEAPVNLRGSDFSFDPRSLDFRPENGGAQHGMSFDSSGRKFVCSNSDHIQMVMYEHRYAERESAAFLPPARLSIAADGPAAEVFRISPDEPWRVIRTQWRVAGLVSGPIEGGGRPSGYFTGATGTTIYRGDAFPESYRENAFIADCGSNLIHRKLLHPDGVALIAERPPDEQGVEFIASRDNWFRPVQFANAPDGCLYVADMYREIIEHPWSLPAPIKRHLDLNSGNDRGRIYRIAPADFKPGRDLPFAKATTADLVDLLEHPNGWHRDTAARLLYQRQDPSAAPRLARMLTRSVSPHGRLHALYALQGLKALEPEHIATALGDSSPLVREHAVRVSGLQSPRGKDTASSRLPDDLWRDLARLATDPSPRVAFELAFRLGDAPPGLRADPLCEIVRRHAEDRWIRSAVLVSLGEEAMRVFDTLCRDPEFRRSNGGATFLAEIASVIGATNRPDELNALLRYLESLGEDDPLALPMVAALNRGLRRAGLSLEEADRDRRFGSLYARASRVVTDKARDLRERITAVELLSGGNAPRTVPLLGDLLRPETPEPLQKAVIAALGRLSDPAVHRLLLQNWAHLTPALRADAVTVLLTRPQRVQALLDAIESGSILASELDTVTLGSLRRHADAAIRERVMKLLPATSTSTREEVIKAFSPALALRGDRANGERIYLERCASCHRSGSLGYALGPDLASVKTAGPEKVLVSILDPNREVAPNYVSYSVETRSGDTHSGLITSESSTSVQLRAANGWETTVPRDQLISIRSSGVSMMPEGLEEGLTVQDMADLLEWVLGDR